MRKESSRPPPLDVLGRIRAPCHPLPGPDQIRRNAHPLRGSDRLGKQDGPGPDRSQDQPPERPPNQPPTAPDPLTPPEAVKKSGSKNPRHVTIVSMACHYCSACHYCTEAERHTACGYCMRHLRAKERNSPKRLMPSLRGAAPTQKQATCGASYKRSVQCSVIALLSTCKACCLLWRYDSP